MKSIATCSRISATGTHSYEISLIDSAGAERSFIFVITQAEEDDISVLVPPQEFVSFMGGYAHTARSLFDAILAFHRGRRLSEPSAPPGSL